MKPVSVKMVVACLLLAGQTLGNHLDQSDTGRQKTHPDWPMQAKTDLVSLLVPEYLTGPSSGTVRGLASVGIFAITVWIMIYNLGTVSFDTARRADDNGSHQTRFQRDLSHASSLVMKAIDYWTNQQF